jgi:hypothetical protein
VTRMSPLPDAGHSLSCLINGPISDSRESLHSPKTSLFIGIENRGGPPRIRTPTTPFIRAPRSALMEGGALTVKLTARSKAILLWASIRPLEDRKECGASPQGRGGGGPEWDFGRRVS